MTWRLKVQGLIFVLLVLAALAVAIGADFTDDFTDLASIL